MSKLRFAPALLALGAAGLSGSLALAAVDVAPTPPPAAGAPADNAFTRQAAEGATVYATQCGGCHGQDLKGGSGPPMSGLSFAARWTGKSTADLYNTIRATMPLARPGSLSNDDYYRITAFLANANGQAPTAALTDAANAHRMAFAQTQVNPGGSDFPLIVPGAGGFVPKLPAEPKVLGKATGPLLPTEAELEHPAPGDWLTFNRDLRGQRYSPLAQITPANAGKLRAVCAYQFGVSGRFQPSPVVYKGVMYVTALGRTVALDAATCKLKWEHEYVSDEPTIIVVNRGVALYKGLVYRSTPSGHLIALDAATGKLVWDTRVSSALNGNLLSAAPVVYDGKVVMAEAGADWGAPGHMHGFDAATGRHLWTFNFVPVKGEFGYDTWGGGREFGGGSSWASFAVDPEKKVVYAPVGNPGPQMDGNVRKGDNLFTNSVVALGLADGKLDWHAQQIRNDTHDWDTAAAPMLHEIGGKRFMTVVNKGGYLWLYDRDTHKLVAKSEVSRQENAETPPPLDHAAHTCPGILGGAQYNGVAYSPPAKALYVGSVEWCGSFQTVPAPGVKGGIYTAGKFTFDPVETAYGWVRSFDAATGRPRWKVRMPTPMVAGITPTASGLLFTGDLNGNFLVLSAADGKVLYRFNTGGAIGGGMSTYTAGGKQYVAVPSGNTSRTMWKTNGSATVFVFAVEGK